VSREALAELLLLRGRTGTRATACTARAALPCLLLPCPAAHPRCPRTWRPALPGRTRGDGQSRRHGFWRAWTTRHGRARRGPAATRAPQPSCSRCPPAHPAAAAARACASPQSTPAPAALRAATDLHMHRSAALPGSRALGTGGAASLLHARHRCPLPALPSRASPWTLIPHASRPLSRPPPRAAHAPATVGVHRTVTRRGGAGRAGPREHGGPAQDPCGRAHAAHQRAGALLGRRGGGLAAAHTAFVPRGSLTCSPTGLAVTKFARAGGGEGR